MTLCLGIRTQTEALIIADSAVTFGHGGQLKKLRSTTGEVHVSGNKTIQEDAQKVFEIVPGIAFSFAGNQFLGNALAEAIVKSIKLNFSIEESIQKAFFACRSSGQGGFPNHVEFLLLDNRNGKADLFHSSTVDQKIEIVSPGNISLFGSVPDDVKGQIGFWTKEIEKLCISGQDLLTTWISILLCITAHRPMIEQGIGGMFTGVRADKSGIGHHKDILFLQYFSVLGPSQTMASAYCVNRDRLSLFSGSARTGNIGPPFPRWQAKWLDKLTNFHDHGIFDYVTFIDLSSWRFIVIHMAGNMERFDVKFRINGELMSVIYSRRLIDYLFSPPRAKFTAHFEPSNAP